LPAAFFDDEERLPEPLPVLTDRTPAIDIRQAASRSAGSPHTKS